MRRGRFKEGEVKSISHMTHHMTHHMIHHMISGQSHDIMIHAGHAAYEDGDGGQ